ncbi:expressed unknown protein [Seminavis robusta]|uniref:Uncharacterized protein n=1 Tax=Seminavis robusta TaxID=568900 RepID=A0A9N8HV03_9STRA|nr:expressed unknown protein [Seminavis robusta]|eukprot:Sro1908_g304750.1 n/a (188) ;mRNA; f:9798-10361
MDGLTGYGSDSSSSIGSMPKSAAASHTANTSQSQPSAQPTKRRRRWDANDSKKSTSSLPAPRLFPSSMLWDVDYLSSVDTTTPHAQDIDDSARTFLEERLKTLDKGTECDSGVAAKLKQSHDFHNPRFLDNAADQIGIVDMLGSNLPEQEVFEDYEYKIIELEGQARARMHEQVDQEQQAQARSMLQ